MNTEYEKIGSVTWINGQPYFLFGSSDQGFIFKDGEAYKNDWDAPCYVPEYAGEDNAVTIDNTEYELGGEAIRSEWYSHNDLLDICSQNREWCDDLFNSLDWCYPETKINEQDDEDIAYHYAFAVNGAKVWWNDPAKETSGVYEIFDSPLQFDEHGELTMELEELLLDTIIKISNGCSEAEVPLCELTPVYPDLIGKTREK